MAWTGLRRQRARRAGLGLAALVAAASLLWFATPREGLGPRAGFDAAVLGDDPEVWLQVSEQRFSDIRPGAAKRILWAGERGVKTPLALVYVHGFAASAEEIRPVPDELARALGANLFFTRLSGQGRAAEAMAKVDAGAWLDDMAEAMAIAHMLGDRVVVIGTSMGGTLAAIAASDPDLSRDLAGVALISPSFALRGPLGALLDAPLPRLWAPLLLGRTQSVAAINSEHARFWLTTWPTAALFPLAALMREARSRDYAQARVPVLVFYSPQDTVIDTDAIAEVTAHWGGSVQIEERQMQAGDDPASHVIAGDVFSPGQSEAVTGLLLAWVRGL